VIVDADAADAPLGEDVRGGGQGLEPLLISCCRPVTAIRRIGRSSFSFCNISAIDLGKAVEDAVT
jgi:hypothetical protein